MTYIKNVISKINLLSCIIVVLGFSTYHYCRGANITLDLYSRMLFQRSVEADVTSFNNIEESDLIRQYRIDFGSTIVSSISVGDTITFRLFEDKDISVSIVEETESMMGRSFIGRVLGDSFDASSCVVLQNENGIVLDMFDWENKCVFQIVSDHNGVIVREKKPMFHKQYHSRPLDRHVSGFESISVDVDITQNNIMVVTNSFSKDNRVVMLNKNTRSKDVKQKVVLDNIGATETDVCTVDILIAYDTEAAKWADENGGGIKAFAETCVQKMNVALSNTGLSRLNRFRLVDVYEIGGSARGNLDYALLYASRELNGMFNGVSWNGVSERREEVGADIVCVLVETGSSIGTVGLGYALKKDSYDVASYGYNVTAIRAVADSHTMTHEVGHNMGAGHSDTMADSSNRGPQYDFYSRGYHFYVDGIGYNTIMGYNFDGYGNYYTPIPYFSSPNYTYRGVAVGDELHDNTRTLSSNFRIIAQNRRSNVLDPVLGDNPLMPPTPEDDPTPTPNPESFFWVTNKIEALTIAKSSGRRIFLVSGRSTSGDTAYFKNKVCEQCDAKKILSDFVLWYSDYDNNLSEIINYTKDIANCVLPLVCVIDPWDSATYISRSVGFMGVSELISFLNKLPDWQPPHVSPEPNPNPPTDPISPPVSEPTSSPTLGSGDYVVNGEKPEGTIPENIVSSYDGYLYLHNDVVGNLQAKVSKIKDGVRGLTVTIQIRGEKKLLFKGSLVVASGVFVATDKNDRVLTLKFDLDGIVGSFGEYSIDGARNFFDSKDKTEKSTAEEILNPYLGVYSMICDGGILSVTIAKKGKVTIKGAIDGSKVSVKAQALIGEKMICIPVIYYKKSVNLAFTIWLPINGGDAKIIGLDYDAIIGKAGKLIDGAKFIIDGDIGASIETEDERTPDLLPNGETITESDSKWLVADGIKPAKVAYKNDELIITEGKKGAGIVNPSGLKLSYKSKNGSFRGSFTAYAIVNGKLKKHKATVEGVLINGVGYGTIVINKIGAWAVTIE